MNEGKVEETPIVEEPQNKEEVDNLKLEIEKLKGEKDGVVNEMKDMRTSNQDLVEKNKDLETKLSPPDDVDLKVQSALETQRKEDAGKNKEAAITRFQDENKDFHPDNDAAKIKWSALLREFDGFNTSNAHSVEDFMSYFDKSKKLLGKEETPTGENIVSEDVVPTNTPPKTAEVSKLSSQEEREIKNLGWTEERYLKVKESQPNFVRKLLDTK